MTPSSNTHGKKIPKKKEKTIWVHLQLLHYIITQLQFKFLILFFNKDC